MTISENTFRQFQIPISNYIQNIQSKFLNGFIKVATVIAIIGIAGSIFTLAPVLGVFSGLMLGVCLIARSAREDAAGRQTAETALRQSERAAVDMQQELNNLRSELIAIEANETQNATLFQALTDRIREQSINIESLILIETDLNQKLHKANELEKQIEDTCAQFRNAITHLQDENKKLL